MKPLVVALIVLGMIGNLSADDYTYIIDTYQTLPDLFGTETMLITNQGGGANWI